MESSRESKQQQPWMMSCGFLTWPPRSYPCSFCKRDFRSAQALGGHMNVHRRDRARARLIRHGHGHAGSSSPPPATGAAGPCPPPTIRAPAPATMIIPNLNHPPPPHYYSDDDHRRHRAATSSKKQHDHGDSKRPAVSLELGAPTPGDDHGGLDLELRLGVS